AARPADTGDASHTRPGGGDLRARAAPLLRV
ncbi:MAG: hypothetical protein AVDCRST_MAG12-212, partial [uncultured Rubrobacteraceae bacterium]